MGRFTGKKVLVTGGGSGVGQATARLFAAEGATVAIAGRDAAKLAETAKDFPQMRVVPTDVNEPAAGGGSTPGGSAPGGGRVLCGLGPCRGRKGCRGGRVRAGWQLARECRRAGVRGSRGAQREGVAV